MKKDFVATCFIVKDGKVLLVKHKKLGLWLPVGGHIEEGETPEQALHREAMEEVGLEIEILSDPGIESCDENVCMLLMPHHMQLELIKQGKEEEHQHIDLIFFCRAKKGEERLNEQEHHSLEWFSLKELESPEITHNVRVLAKKAIEFVEKKP